MFSMLYVTQLQLFIVVFSSVVFFLLFFGLVSYNLFSTMSSFTLIMAILFIILLVFDTCLFVFIFFFIYSSFFLVMLLCINMLVNLRSFYRIDFFAFFIILFLFFYCIYLIIINMKIPAFFVSGIDLVLCDFFFYFIQIEISDLGLIGSLLFQRFPLLVIMFGVFLFLGFVGVPAICRMPGDLQGNMLKTTNKPVYKRF